MEPQQPAAAADNPPEISRGGCLAAWLIFMIIVNAGTALVYILRSDLVLEYYPRLSRGGVGLMASATVSNIVLAVLVWNWRRVGVWGFLLVALIAFPINLYIGVGFFHAALGLLGPLLLGALVRPKWASFK